MIGVAWLVGLTILSLVGAVAVLLRRLRVAESRIRLFAETARQSRQTRRQIETIVDHLPVRISHFDRNERVLYANGYCGLIHGCDPQLLVGRTVREVRGAQSYEESKPYIDRVLAGEYVRFEHPITVEGELRHFQQQYIPDVGPDGAVRGFYSIAYEITERRREEQRLLLQSREDTLTGLWNRRELESRLPDAMTRSRRTGKGMAVVYLDIDHFKSINDTLGHAAGDEVLRAFSQRIKRSVRETDTLARLAGDEFVLILEAVNHTREGEAVVRKVLAALRDPFVAAGRTLTITASAGMTWFDGGKSTSAELLTRADAALYEAKRAGRNTVRLADVEAQH